MQSIYEIRDYKSGSGVAFTGTLYKEGLIFGSIERYRSGVIDIVAYDPNDNEDFYDYSAELIPDKDNSIYEHVNRLVYVVRMNRKRCVCYVEGEEGEKKFWEKGRHKAYKSSVSWDQALYLLKEGGIDNARLWVKSQSRFVPINEL